MGIKQILMDVDKALEKPTLIQIAQAIEAQPEVDGLAIIVTEIDMGTGISNLVYGSMLVWSLSLAISGVIVAFIGYKLNVI